MTGPTKTWSMRPTDERSRRDALRVEFYRVPYRNIDAVAENVRKLLRNGYRLRVHSEGVGGVAVLGSPTEPQTLV
jgi:hypothetical protein